MIGKFRAAKFLLPFAPMSDPFLVLPGTKRKRTRNTRTPGKTPSQAKRTQRRKDARGEKKPRRMRDRSHSHSGTDGGDDDFGPGRMDDSDIEVEEPSEEESETEETPAERRLRLAKEYLDKVRVEAGTVSLAGEY